MRIFKLKEIREDSDKTQQEIADILKVKRGTYASWECGVDIIPTRMLFNFANYYHKSIDYILLLSNKNNSVNYNKPINKISIGKRLKSIRDKASLTQEQIAKSVGINQSTWWAYEKGKTLITTSTLIELSKKYNYSVDWVLGRIN